MNASCDLKNTVIISLGSNKGNRTRNQSEALFFLLSDDRISLSRISSLYLTEPVDDEDQKSFYNSVARLNTSLGLREIFARIQEAEAHVGKEKEREKGPRRIDIDILFFNDSVVSDKDLKVPHPSIGKRLFVLKPLMEICPFYVHPVLRKTVRDLYFSLETDKIARLIRNFPCSATRHGNCT